jgi:hypothetical protein
MADPVTWVAIISAAVGAVGAISQGQAAAKSAKSQAQAADYNAKLAEGQAETARRISTQEQLAHSRRTNQIQGMQRAAVAQSGTGFEGSNDDILDQSATLAELEGLNIAYNGNLRAQGFTSQSALDTYQAGVSRSNASSAQTAGYLNAASAVIGGIGRTYTPAAKSVIGTGNFYGIRPSSSSGIGLRFG